MLLNAQHAGVNIEKQIKKVSHQLKGFPVSCLSRLQVVCVNYIKYCAEGAFPLTRKMMEVEKSTAIH